MVSALSSSPAPTRSLVMGTHCLQRWHVLLLCQWSPHHSHCTSMTSAAHLVPELVSHPPLLLHLEHHLFKPLLSPAHQLAREDALPMERYERENQESCSPGAQSLKPRPVATCSQSVLCPLFHPQLAPTVYSGQTLAPRLPPENLVLSF